MKKKILSMGLVMTLLASMLMAGCGGSSDSGEASSGSGEAGTKEENVSSGPSIEEQVLVEAEGVKLTATDFIIEDGNAVLCVTLENNYENEVETIETVLSVTTCDEKIFRDANRLLENPEFDDVKVLLEAK